MKNFKDKLEALLLEYQLEDDIQPLPIREMTSAISHLFNEYVPQLEQVDEFLAPAIKYGDARGNDHVQMLLLRLLIEEVYELSSAFANGRAMFWNLIGDLKEDKEHENPFDFDKVVGEVDLVEALDGLVDINVILHNITLRLGLQDKFGEAFYIVMQNNLNKVRMSKEAAELVQASHEGSTIVDLGNGYYSVKRADGKILKAAGENVKQKLQNLLFG